MKDISIYALYISILTVACFSFLIILRTIGGPIMSKIISLDLPLLLLMELDIFFTSALSFWTIKNRFEYKYKEIVGVTLLSNVVGTLLSLLLVLLSHENKVFYRIFGTVAVHVLIYGPLYMAIMKKGKTGYDKEYWSYSISYNAPLIPHYLSQQVLNQSDRIMISSMTGNADAGVYSLAYQIAIAIRIFTDSIFSSFDPWTFQCIEVGEINKIGKRAFQIELFIGIICCGFSLFAPEMILFMGGNTYSFAAYLIPSITMSVLFITIYSFFSSIEFYYEKTKKVMIASGSVAILNIILNWIFIRLYGFVAAAYTTLVCYIVYALIHYIFMLHTCKKQDIENPFPFRLIWIPAIIFVILSFAISSLYQFTYLRYAIIVGIICMFIYLYKTNKIKIK